jgi:hypothetical protein
MLGIKEFLLLWFLEKKKGIFEHQNIPHIQELSNKAHFKSPHVIRFLHFF